MNLPTLLTWHLIILTLDLALTALFVLCRAIFSGVVTRARLNVERMPIRSFMIGLVNAAFFGLVSVALLSSFPILKLVGLVLGMLLLFLVALGLSAVTQFVGERIDPNRSAAVSPLILGAATLELSTLVPVVGWFVVPLLAVSAGFGATLLALIWRRTP